METSIETFDWRWQTRDGLQLYARGSVPQTPEAVVTLVHGHGDHSGRYPHVARAFCQAGYAFMAFDLRGHGLSDGKRGHIPSYDAVMDDIADFLGQVALRFADLPQILYGHSLGGNLVANYILRREHSLAAALITGPWFRLAFEPPPEKISLAQMMARIAPGFTQPSGLDVTGLSRDVRVVQAYTSDPLVHNKISAGSFVAFHAAGYWALEHAPEWRLPTLLLHGGADRLTSPQASREFAERAGAIVNLHILEGLYHEIHNEPEQEQVLAVMLDGLKALVNVNG